MNKQEILSQLVSMSSSLGQPERDYVILGEGNTSAWASEESYFVKASGFQLHNIQPEGFIELKFAPVLALLEQDHLDDTEVSRQLASAKVDPSLTTRPSIEATMHAVIYALCGAGFVGHTHPTAVNALLCSKDYQEALQGRLFPDHIVFCGTRPAILPYVEPGLPLARLLKRTLEEHLDRYGEMPKVIYLQNHGLIAVGKSAVEVESITAMTVKACRVLLGTAGFGGPHFLTEEDIHKIHTMPGEQHRRKLAGY